MALFHSFLCLSNTHIWRRQWHPTPVLLPGKSYRRRSLVGCSPWGRWESDTTEQLHFHFHALEKEMATHSSSCLENPRDGGAWWAAVCGVAQSRTRLKRLSSSSSKDLDHCDIEWFALETNRAHSVIFETARKYCILDSC